MKDIKEAQASLKRDFDEANLWLITRPSSALRVKYDGQKNVLMLEGDAGVIIAALMQKVKALKSAIDVLLDKHANIEKETS